MSNELSKIIDFAQKTGDKVIVTDKEGRDPVVVMPFEMYRHLLGSSPKVDLNDPNYDQEEEVFLPEEEYFDDLALETAVSEPVSVPKKPEKAQKPQNDQKQNNIPPKLAENNDDDEDVGEEQFYLEPVQ